MLYNWDTHSNLITALNNSGITKTIYYSDATNVIFSAPAYSNKVIRIGNNIIYIGDSWTSGTTITNQVIVTNSGASIGTGNCLVITPNIIGFMLIPSSNPSSNFVSAIFGKLSTGDFTILVNAGITATTTNCKNTTANKDLILLKLTNSSLPLQSSDGFYYEHDVKFKDVGHVMDPTVSMVGVKFLTKIGAAPAYVTTYSNDISFFISMINSVTYNNEIVIKNGNV